MQQDNSNPTSVVLMYKNYKVHLEEYADGRVWFAVNDIGSILGLSNPRKAIQSIPKEERCRMSIPGQPVQNWISRDGLVSILQKSRKDEAKGFLNWVQELGLQGSYTLVTPPLPDRDKLHLLPLDQQVRCLEEVLYQYAEVTKTYAGLVNQLQDRVRSLEKGPFPDTTLPPARYPTVDYSIEELAGFLNSLGIKVDTQELYTWLRANEYLSDKEETWNQPTEKSLNKSLFRAVTVRYMDEDSRKWRVSLQPRCTVIGLQYFLASRECIQQAFNYNPPQVWHPAVRDVDVGLPTF